MPCDQILTTLNILIAFIGVLFVGLTIYEYWKLSTIRKEFHNFREELADASVYLMEGSIGLCLEYLEKAVIVDPTSRNDLKDNTQVAKVAEHPKYQALIESAE